jgi:charged multivesicular body protein 1
LQVTGSMANIVRGMDAALASMDMQRITTVMDKFEQQFEDLDVQANYVENSMNSTTALTTPPDEVILSPLSGAIACSPDSAG